MDGISISQALVGRIKTKDHTEHQLYYKKAPSKAKSYKDVIVIGMTKSLAESAGFKVGDVLDIIWDSELRKGNLYKVSQGNPGRKLYLYGKNHLAVLIPVYPEFKFPDYYAKYDLNFTIEKNKINFSFNGKAR